MYPVLVLLSREVRETAPEPAPVAAPSGGLFGFLTSNCFGTGDLLQFIQNRREFFTGVSDPVSNCASDSVRVPKRASDPIYRLWCFPLPDCRDLPLCCTDVFSLKTWLVPSRLRERIR